MLPKVLLMKTKTKCRIKILFYITRPTALFIIVNFVVSFKETVIMGSYSHIFVDIENNECHCTRLKI